MECFFFVLYFTRLSGRPSSLSIVNIFSLCIYIIKQKKKVRGFIKKDFQNLMKIEFRWRIILKLWSFINLPWDHVISQTKFGPDRFIRFTFIGYKQADKHPDKQSIFIEDHVFCYFIILTALSLWCLYVHQLLPTNGLNLDGR